MQKMKILRQELKDALLNVNRIGAEQVFEKCYKEYKTFESLESLVIKTLEEIGIGWEKGEYALSQSYMSGVICESIIEKYIPIFDAHKNRVPKMSIATLNDYHGLGKKIIYSTLRAEGYEVIDFGEGLSVDELVEITIENEIELLLISTLMLPSALKVKQVKQGLIARGCNAKVVVGGAPFRFDENLWITVGADYDGKNASNLLKYIEMLIKGETA
jgi:monomethylamine corrinoid protein